MEERRLPLNKDDLEALPRELVRELATVVVTLDSKRIKEVIARISNCDETVGHKLASLADCFSYTAIMNWVDGNKQSQKG